MPTITTTNCRSPGGTYAPFDSADSNNFQTLLIKYVQLNSFRSGTVTTNSDFARNVFRCPVRLKENHWRNIKEFDRACRAIRGKSAMP